jgi:hypothetical protein
MEMKMKMKMKMKIRNLQYKCILLSLLLISHPALAEGKISAAVNKIGELIYISNDVFIKAIAFVGVIFFAMAFIQWRKLSSGGQGGGNPATVGGIVVGFISGIAMATIPWWIDAGQDELGVETTNAASIEIVTTQQLASIDTSYIVNKTS